VESLEHRIKALEENHVQLRQRIEKLENRLNQNSQNSNKPPSSDPQLKPISKNKRLTWDGSFEFYYRTL
jgi:BMFP domain-containing protein YqiC